MGATRLSSRRRQDQGFKWARIVMAVLATIGIIDTGSITLERWGLLGDLNCPMGADGCDKVLNSAWGTVAADIPLSFVGLLAYIAVLLLAVLPLLPGLQENKADLSRRTWWGLDNSRADQRLERLIHGLSATAKSSALSELLFDYNFERYGLRLLPYLF